MDRARLDKVRIRTHMRTHTAISLLRARDESYEEFIVIANIITLFVNRLKCQTPRIERLEELLLCAKIDAMLARKRKKKEEKKQKRKTAEFFLSGERDRYRQTVVKTRDSRPKKLIESTITEK